MLFGRTNREVTQDQAAAAAAGTRDARAGWAASRGRRTIGVARPTVYHTNGASTTPAATPRH